MADESNHSAMGMLHLHGNAMCLYITLHWLSNSSASLTEDINPQSSHWNNGKMKIACNSAYVQTKTLNFTFARQAVIVYFCICSNHRCIKCMWLLSLWQYNVITSPCITARCYNLLRQSQNIGNSVTVLHISLKPQHQPQTWWYLWKANEPPIPMIYCVYRNTVNFSCTNQIHFC